MDTYSLYFYNHSTFVNLHSWRYLLFTFLSSILHQQEIKQKVNRWLANHSLSSTASQGTSNIPFLWFLLLGCNRQARNFYSYNLWSFMGSLIVAPQRRILKVLEQKIGNIVVWPKREILLSYRHLIRIIYWKCKRK